jgi:hypothetical protein
MATGHILGMATGQILGMATTHTHIATSAPLCDPADVERINNEIIVTVPNATRFPDLHATQEHKDFWNSVASLLPPCNMMHRC